MKPRRHARSLSALFAHPWHCVRCRRSYPEHHMIKYKEVGVDLFACPVCRLTVGARYLW